jgi:hypothetical protein
MLEITIQRRMGKAWPVVGERHRTGALLPVRHEGQLEKRGRAGGRRCAPLRLKGAKIQSVMLHDYKRDAVRRVPALR